MLHNVMKAVSDQENGQGDQSLPTPRLAAHHIYFQRKHPILVLFVATKFDMSAASWPSSTCSLIQHNTSGYIAKIIATGLCMHMEIALDRNQIITCLIEEKCLNVLCWIFPRKGEEVPELNHTPY